MSIKRDSTEAATNVILGGVINYLLTLALFGVTMKFAVWTTVIFIAVSYSRSLLIRRYFRRGEV
jgi:hypothetical protein